MGTGNDFARTINMSANVSLLKKNIDADYYELIDLGLAHFIDSKGFPSSRFFINITDIGIGGVIAQKLISSSRRMSSFLTFQRAIISTLMSYRKQHVHIEADSFHYDGAVMNVVIANGKFFGSGMGIAPEALPGDGLFSVVIIGKVTMLDYIKLLGEVRKCKKIKHAGFTYKIATKISLDSPGISLPIDMDGEFIGYSPMSIEIVHHAIKFICTPDIPVKLY
jgi:diacylglycerol kinase family enzyme